MPRSFLRNTILRRLQCEAEASGAALQLLDDPLAVSLLVLIDTRVLILHSEAHRPVEEDGELARCGGHRLGLTNARRQPSIERTEGCLGAPDVHGHQA